MNKLEFKHMNMQEFKHMNMQEFKHMNMQEFKHVEWADAIELYANTKLRNLYGHG